MSEKEESTGENEKEEIDGKSKATITDKTPESTRESPSEGKEPQSPKKDASTDPIEESGDQNAYRLQNPFLYYKHLLHIHSLLRVKLTAVLPFVTAYLKGLHTLFRKPYQEG